MGKFFVKILARKKTFALSSWAITEKRSEKKGEKERGSRVERGKRKTEKKEAKS